MNVKFNSFFLSTLSFFKDNMLDSISSQQKNIIVVAATAFGMIALCFTLYRFCHIDLSLNGQQIFCYSDKKILEGRFILGLPHGQIMVYKNGKVKEVEYKFGLKHGHSKTTKTNGKVKEKEYKLGSKEGRYKLTMPNGDIKEYKCTDNHREDHPYYQKLNTITINGKKEEAEYNSDDSRHGLTKITAPDGVIMELEFKDGILDGRYKVTKPDGTVAEAQFKSGVPKGQTAIVLANGDKVENLRHFTDSNGVKSNLKSWKMLMITHADGTIDLINGKR